MLANLTTYAKSYTRTRIHEPTRYMYNASPFVYISFKQKEKNQERP